jgi:hypothetical protein
MVDSYGTPTPSTLRSPGPTPDFLVDKTALTHLKFEPTPEGMQVMGILFPAALGAMYANFFNKAITTKDFELRTRQDVALAAGVYNKLVVTMSGHGRVLLNMTAQNGRNGPKCFNWLDAKYNRSDTNAAVQKLRDIVDLAPFPSDDVDACIDQLLTANAANEGLVLPDKFMSALIVLKLPEACDVISKVQLAKPALPPPDELQAEIARTLPTKPGSLSALQLSAGLVAHPIAFVAAEKGAAGARSAGRPQRCRNCDSPDHLIADCTLPKGNCSVCGFAAGHVDNHCLAQSDGPIPSGIPAPVKAKLLERRTAYLAAKAAGTIAVAVELPSLADEAELMTWLEDNCSDCDE